MKTSLLLGLVLFVGCCLCITEPDGTPIPQGNNLQNAFNSYGTGIQVSGARLVGSFEVANNPIWVTKFYSSAAYRSIIGWYDLSAPNVLYPFLDCSTGFPFGPVEFDLRATGNGPNKALSGSIGIFGAVSSGCATVTTNDWITRSVDNTVTNLILNGGFETTSCTSFPSQAFCTFPDQVTLPSWNVQANVDLVRADWPAHTGTFSVDLNGYANAAVLYQDIPTDTGRQYNLQFWLNGNYDNQPSGTASRTVKVQIETTTGNIASVMTFSHVYNSLLAHNAQIWVLCSLSFQAPATTTRIAFLSEVDNCCYGPAIDDVSVKLSGIDGIYLLAFNAPGTADRVAIALEDTKQPNSDLDFDDEVFFIDNFGPGPCTHLYNGATCDDGDNCTTGDVCYDGLCAGTVVNCPADACHPNAGSCDRTTAGQCVYAGALTVSGNTCCPLDLPCSPDFCGLFPTRFTCPYKHAYPAEDDCCGSSGGHAMWTKFSDSPPYGFGEDRWIFQEINGITTGVFIEFSEGYGRLEGILVGLNDPNNMWKLNLEMVYLPELGSFHVKNELAAACASLQQDWWFYNIRSDCESLLVGMGENLGLTIVLGLEATGYYPIQVGPGASMKNSQPGFTTWLTYKEFRYNSTLWGSKPQLAFSHAPYGNNDGDLNINIECPSKCPPFPTPICGDGIVSGSEQCDDGPHGSPCCTTTCQFQPSGHPCRLSAGDCDVVEVCSGKSNVCPPDTYAPSTTVCLSGAGFCDLKVSTYCTGNSPICPGVPTIPLRQQQISWDNFNLISCLDFKAGSGDIEGRAAVKRNWNTTGGFSIGLKVDSTATGPDRRQDFSLVVGHNCSFAAGSILPDGSGNPNNSPEEDIFVGEVWTGPAYLSLRVRDQSAVIGDKDAYFDAGCSYFTSLSNYFAAQTPNTAWTPYYGSGIHIKCTSSVETLYYVQIDAASLSASNWWSLEQCNMAAFFVITVTGTGDVTFKGGAFPSVTEKVIFNVPGTGRTVDVETGLQGNLLAPGCSFKQTNGVTLGLVIVYTVLSFVQANKPNCLLWNPIQITGKVAGPIQSVPYPTPTKRYATTVSVIPVFDFGTWSVGDKVQIGNETCTIVGGTMSGDSPSLLCIPALTGSYDQGTDITGTVQLVDASWLRNTVNENMTYTPSDPDQSVAPSTGSQASSGSQPPLTTSPATIITDVTGASTGSSQPSETSSQLSSGKPATTVKLTGAETSSASSLAAYFAVILVTLTIALF